MFEVLNIVRIKVLHIFRLLKDKKNNRQKHENFLTSEKSDAKQKSFKEVLDIELSEKQFEKLKENIINKQLNFVI